MPGKFQGIDPLLQTITGKVLLLDHFHPELKGKYSSVAQNFAKDTYEALNFGLKHIKNISGYLWFKVRKKNHMNDMTVL